MADARFEACLAIVLDHEGGYADHPADPGGATNLGITRRTLADWRQVSPWTDLPKSEVRALQRPEAAHIYRALYWQRCRGDEMPAGLDLALFDFAVNSGPDRAIRQLQRLLGVAADGQIGPITLAAIAKRNTGPALAGLIAGLCDARLRFLKQLRGFATFGKGWTRRVAAIRSAALAASGSSPLSPSPRNGRSSLDILNGYKTYITAILMLLAGLAQAFGIDLPVLEGGSAGQMIMEALALIFLRQGIRADSGRA
ncbi:glycoside hydrolase family 108 protein [Devosia aquimaris]|uniref:glycoside hydrolase family 108 protein n=1 Tax=Devosia aquimaris TaxID=2866214 RepID=UPI001CD0558A|nr:glycoside hydrolase family 108 protein [Devosia sp. CJK-A8-3]